MGNGENVREATKEDARSIHALTCDLAEAVGDARPDPDAVRGRLAELLDEPRARVFVAEDGGNVVGAASIWIKPDLAHGDTVIEVPMLVVSANHRRRGAGTLLMAEIKNLATESGASLIELVATRNNKTARSFYRSLGFVETDHISLEYVGGL